MAPQDPDNTAAAGRVSATDASAAISRMRSAPAFFSDDDWRVLEPNHGSALVGNTEGLLLESLDEDDEDS